jgi:hypothetical protein
VLADPVPAKLNTPGSKPSSDLRFTVTLPEARAVTTPQAVVSLSVTSPAVASRVSVNAIGGTGGHEEMTIGLADMLLLEELELLLELELELEELELLLDELEELELELLA